MDDILLEAFQVFVTNRDFLCGIKRIEPAGAKYQLADRLVMPTQRALAA
ncbi:hypothetical protein PQR02_19410 [Paraburkholderia sediminicola]|uniref:Uncharacterized protein n=1 Tax=Paraburkholderia rhynchosiae TaxID=487049 RepID=A0ACC7NI87_9BURK